MEMTHERINIAWIAAQLREPSPNLSKEDLILIHRASGTGLKRKVEAEAAR
jgi:hypothetical protein